MAVVSARIDASPETIFAVLADGWLYSNWVVGSSHVRAVEADWPAVGAKIFHAAGVWPLVTRDETAVESVEPDRQLTLIARGRPLGEARVHIALAADGGATTVTMTETPVAGPGKWADNPLLEAVLKRRNVEALARLAAISLRLTQPVE